MSHVRTGNDFLPHLPSLDIRDGAIDFLTDTYKQLLPSLGTYLTSPGGEVNLTEVDIILSRVAEIEDVVFRRRKEADQEQTRRRKQNASRVTPHPSHQPTPHPRLALAPAAPRATDFNAVGSDSAIVVDNQTAADRLRANLKRSHSQLSVDADIAEADTSMACKCGPQYSVQHSTAQHSYIFSAH